MFIFDQLDAKDYSNDFLDAMEDYFFGTFKSTFDAGETIFTLFYFT